MVYKSIEGYGDHIEFARKCSCTFNEAVIRRIPLSVQGEQWDNEGYPRGIDWLKTGIDFLTRVDKRTLLLWGKTYVGKTFLTQQLQIIWGKKHGLHTTEFIHSAILTETQYGAYGHLKNEDYLAARLLILDDFFCNDIYKDNMFVSAFEVFFDNLKAEKILLTMNANPYINIQNGAPTIFKRLAKNGDFKNMINPEREKRLVE